MNTKKFADSLLEDIADSIEILPMDQLIPALKTRLSTASTVLVDPDCSPVAVSIAAGKAGATVLESRSLLTITKALKNPTELSGMRDCHMREGSAWVEFSAWLMAAVPARAYTAVLKAFIALSTLRFPHGTQGHHIDAICWRPMWDMGLDYDHGTGHGVGHCLSVHEQPQRIAKAYNPVDLRPGMVLSIEPGHYMAGRYGIRIENLFEITLAADGYMEFENMTYTPIQTDILELGSLSTGERSWLNRYHISVEKALSGRLSAGAAVWLKKTCVPI